jgi:hypothetical protein
MGIPTAPDPDDRVIQIPLRDILMLEASQDINQFYQEWSVVLYLSMPRAYTLHGFWNKKDCEDFVENAKNLPKHGGIGWVVKYVLHRGKPLDIYLRED